MKMNEEEFTSILEETLLSTSEVLGIKAKEYVRNGDRLHNFNRGEAITGMIREKVLWNGFALKHYVSILDILDDVEKGQYPTEALVNEKVGDLINYLILLKACLIQKARLNQ